MSCAVVPCLPHRASRTSPPPCISTSPANRTKLTIVWSQFLGWHIFFSKVPPEELAHAPASIWSASEGWWLRPRLSAPPRRRRLLGAQHNGRGGRPNSPGLERAAPLGHDSACNVSHILSHPLAHPLTPSRTPSHTVSHTLPLSPTWKELHPTGHLQCLNPISPKSCPARFPKPQALSFKPHTPNHKPQTPNPKP